MAKKIEMTASERRDWQRLYDSAWSLLDNALADGTWTRVPTKRQTDKMWNALERLRDEHDASGDVTARGGQ